MTTFNHTPYPVGMAAQAALFNAALAQLDEAIGLHNRTATTNPTVSNDSSQGYAAGRSVWLNTVSNTVFMCVDDAVGAAQWVETASSAALNLDTASLSGTLALAQGGTNTNLSSSGPGWWRQNSSGAGVTVRELLATDIPSLTSRMSVSGADAFSSSNLLDAVAKSQIKLNGTTIGSRRGINLIPVAGSSATIEMTVTDSAIDEHVNVQIGVAGGGVGTDELVKVGVGGTPDYLSSDYFYRDPTNHIQFNPAISRKVLISSLDTSTSPPGGDAATFGSLPASLFSTYSELLLTGKIRRNGAINSGLSTIGFRIDNIATASYRRNVIYNNGSTLSVLADGSAQTSLTLGQLDDNDTYETDSLLELRIIPRGAIVLVNFSLVRLATQLPTYWSGYGTVATTTSPSILSLISTTDYYFDFIGKLYGVTP